MILLSVCLSICLFVGPSVMLCIVATAKVSEWMNRKAPWEDEVTTFIPDTNSIPETRLPRWWRLADKLNLNTAGNW